MPLWKNFTFDLIRMDLMMPVMDGYEATEAIRTYDKEDAKKCIDAGMNGHLAKPIEMPKLIQILSEVLS